METLLNNDFKVSDFINVPILEFDGFNNGLVKTKIIRLKAIINDIKDNLALIEYFEDGQKLIGYKFQWVNRLELKHF